ncbi:hypothetical protein LUZ61_008568 [Rhynchospora tenuis]|uniref:BTB domain-containing protein n=1 Tax=Rhynchospora tenuis TaxID=198213 RepID=A0AAD6EXK8_9POAL|nr:hypothetical protein LUZ61_008568 [Rhynchospora tenuis]
MSLSKYNKVGDFLSIGVPTVSRQLKFRYSETKELPAGESIISPTFSVAGHNCKILYYPQPLVDYPESTELDLVLDCTSEVTAAFGYSFLDKHGRPDSKTGDRLIFTFSPECRAYGFKDIIKKSNLEAEFVKEDYFTLVCCVTILSHIPKEVPKQLFNGIIPWSINDNFAELLENKEMADITFEVDGETFTAHKLVLATRSPVFKAELFGGMVESKMKSVQIKDIKPLVFKAMLHFIYTDSMPNMSDKDIQLVAFAQYLLKAADKYALDGLKMICEERLAREVSMDTVISSLALAEEHKCPDLKHACIDFASKPENLVHLALNAEYVQLVQCNPSLLKEIGDRARANIDFSNLFLKKRRINQLYE